MDLPEKINYSQLQNKNQHMDKRSQINVCQYCGVRSADSLLGKLCSICFRKLSFEKLPQIEQRREMLSVVPERYITAEIAHLPAVIQDAFIQDITDGVLLWGTPGSGKTYAMAALAKKYVADGFRVDRVHYEMLCLKLRDTFNKNANHTEFQVIEPLLNCDKLFIEDVGVSRRLGNQESDHSVRTFQVILDMRLERCRPTFVTSNKSLENLAQSFDERVGDRLRLFRIFEMNAKSKRNA